MRLYTALVFIVANFELVTVLLRRASLCQTMRIRGEGDTAVTNPHIKIRHRFRKLYEVSLLFTHCQSHPAP